jgi:hypothetical protein
MKTTLNEMELRKTALYIRVQAAQLLEHAEKTGSGSSRNKCRELCDIAEKLDVMRAELVASFNYSRHDLDRVPDNL